MRQTARRWLMILGVSAALCAVTACEDKKEDATQAEKAGEGAEAATDAPAGAAEPGAEKKEPPPPPEEAFKGQARVVNVYLDAEGNTPAVDVWAKPSFTAGAVQLAEGVEFGTASDWFKVPDGQSVVIVESGAGVSGESLGGVSRPNEGDYVTAVLALDKGGKPSAGNTWEVKADKPDETRAAPPAGKGLVVLRAGQLSAHEEGLKETYGGRSFFVGNAQGECRPPRGAAEGAKPVTLGGTQPTVHEVDAGKATVSLHKWPSDGECTGEPVHTFEVDVPDGAGVLVHVYTPDGKTLETLQVPLGLPAAS